MKNTVVLLFATKPISLDYLDRENSLFIYLRLNSLMNTLTNVMKVASIKIKSQNV